MREKRKKLIIVDGNGLAYRAFYALPPLKTSQGEPVNAVYGFTNMLFKIIEREKPAFLGVAFDKSKPTKRLEEFDQYKAHRQKMPEELARQMPIMEEVVSAFNIPVYHVEGYEADDCIATLAHEGEKQGYLVKIYSGDLDMLQLVTDDTLVVTTRRGISDLVIYDRDMVRKRYSINPPQLVDYKALAGDSSDHIPGIPGIGEASASKLLNQFESIEEMYEQAARIPSRWRKQILENREQAFLSKRLASLEKEMDLGLDWDQLALSSPDREQLKKLFIRLEFKTLLKKMGFKEEELTEIQEIVVQIVGKDEDMDMLLSGLKSAGAFSVVWIANEDEDLVGLAIARGKNNGYYFPFILPEQLNIASTFGISIYSKERVIHELKAYMENGDFRKYVFDLKSGVKFLKRSEYFNGKGFFDFLIAAHLIDPDDAPKTIESVLAKFTDFVPKTLSEIAFPGKPKKKLKVMEVPLQDLTLFLAGRAVRINSLGPDLLEKVEKAGVVDYLDQVESPLTILLSVMEVRGITIDVTALKEEQKDLENQIEEVAQAIYKDAGKEFNVNSTRQLGRVLFEDLKLPGAKPTATGYRTDAEVLSRIKDSHPVVERVLKYRELSRTKSSFVDSLLDQVDESTGKINLQFRQTGTVMGEITTSSPNLKSLPTRIRRVFVPSASDKVMLDFEYHHLNLSVLAHLSKDEKLTSVMKGSEKIEKALASALFDKTLDKLDESDLNIAVEVAYAFINGISAQALSQKLNIKRKEAKKLKEKFLKSYPGVKKFYDQTMEQARKDESVRSILGRRRLLPGINSKNKGMKKNSEKMALQFVIQGGAGDIIKKTMVECLEKILRGHRDIHLLIQLRNEFLFETRKRRAEKYTERILEIMESAAGLDVPVKVTAREGNNWLNMNMKEAAKSK